MRNESQDNFLALHDTVFLCGVRHPHPKLYMERQENAGAEGEKKKKEHSHLMLLSWFPTLVASPSSRAQAGPALAGGAAALGV